MDDHDHDHDDRRGDPDVGSLADEATRLLGALGGWARDHGAPDVGAGAAAASEPDALTGDCAWCPVCRTAHAVRRTSPEVRDQLLVAATSLMQAGAGLLAALQASAEDRGTRSSRPERPERPGASRVERIDLDDTPTDMTDEQRQGEA